MYSLTHQFIVKMYTYLQGYMFQLYIAIIRPVLKNRSISNFIFYSWAPKCLQSEILLCTVFWLCYNEVKMDFYTLIDVFS